MGFFLKLHINSIKEKNQRQGMHENTRGVPTVNESVQSIGKALKVVVSFCCVTVPVRQHALSALCQLFCLIQAIAQSFAFPNSLMVSIAACTERVILEKGRKVLLRCCDLSFLKYFPNGKHRPLLSLQVAE